MTESTVSAAATHCGSRSSVARRPAQSEGRVERGALRRGQVRGPEPQRANQLMQARERQMRLGLHSGRAHHREAAFARRRGRRGQQPGLADARLAVQHERPAAAGGQASSAAAGGQASPAAATDAVKQRGQQLDLGVPADQRPRVTRGDGHQRTILAGRRPPRKSRNLRHELSHMTYAAFVPGGLPFRHPPISPEEGSP